MKTSLSYFSLIVFIIWRLIAQDAVRSDCWCCLSWQKDARSRPGSSATPAKESKLAGISLLLYLDNLENIFIFVNWNFYCSNIFLLDDNFHDFINFLLVKSSSSPTRPGPTENNSTPVSSQPTVLYTPPTSPPASPPASPASSPPTPPPTPPPPSPPSAAAPDIPAPSPVPASAAAAPRWSPAQHPRAGPVPPVAPPPWHPLQVPRAEVQVQDQLHQEEDQWEIR